MVAINVIRQEQFVYIVSDGAFCDNAGIVCEISPKAFALPHFPAALAIRGPSHFMPFLVHRLSRECQSFDEALTRIAQTAREVYLSFPMAMGTLEFGAVEPDFDLIAAGWSKVRGRPESYLVSSHDRLVAREVTARAWHLVELPDILIAPPVTEVALASALIAPPTTGKELTFADWKARYSTRPFRPDVDGVMLLNAQRRSPRELDPRLGLGSGPVYMVGGFIQVTSVSSQGTVSEVLHRWPDKVGGRIDPQASEPAS
jgi:hypothetical protein